MRFQCLDALNGLAQPGQHFYSTLHCRSGADAVKSGTTASIVVPVNTLVLPAPQPWVYGDVGNGVPVAGNEFVSGELLVHHAVQPSCFVGVAVKGVVDLFRGIFPEMMGLPQHWADATHLEHQPLQHLEFMPVTFGQQLTGFRCEVKEDGTGFKLGNIFAIRAAWIDQG